MLYTVAMMGFDVFVVDLRFICGSIRSLLNLPTLHSESGFSKGIEIIMMI